MADTMIGIPIGTITMTAGAPGGYYFVETGDIAMTPLVPYGYVGLSAEVLATAKKIYRCILTGAENELDDLIMPMSGFSATVRDGDPSYLQCTIPAGSDYLDAVLLRTDGDIVVKCGYVMADGTEYLEEIVRVNYENMRVERAVPEDKMTISGTKTRTLNQSKEWTLQGTSYYTINEEGKRRVRGTLDFNLRCGDILTYGDEAGDYLTVGAITYAVAARPAMEYMEVEEA